MDLIDILGYIVGFAFCYLAWRGMLVAGEIHDARKKAWRAGTHDYYGNKIDESDDD